jgi:translation initiation factor eIF-2B subunit alpha
MATIEALIEALGASSATTVFETMKLVEAQSDRLRQNPTVANPMAVRHGSDFFKQYLVRELRQLPSSGASGSRNEDQQFEVIRQHLLRNARLFATRAKDAREKIASEGRYVMRVRVPLVDIDWLMEPSFLSHLRGCSLSSGFLFSLRCDKC